MKNPLGMHGVAILLGLVLAGELGAAPPPAPPPPTWKAGVAAACITPRQPMWMSGYAARKKPSEGTTQDLFAKALVLEDQSGQRVAIITLDLIGVVVTLREAMEKQLFEKHQLPPESLLMAASHTHSGPEYRSSREEAQKYHQFLEATLLRLVGDAINDLKPSYVAYGHARAGFAMNRRRNHQLSKDDVNYNKAPNPDGPVDHDVPVLAISQADGTLRVLLFGYACHNTTLGFYEFCGDYAGYAQEYLQAGHPGVTAMFITGCGADQNPYPRSKVELAKEHGRTLATAVDAALFAGPRPVLGVLRCGLERLELRKNPEDAATTLSYPVQVIRFGSDVVLVALASEVVVDYSLRLKRELAGSPPGGPAVWVAGYTNGYFGYIPSQRIFQEGGYEAGSWKQSIEEPVVSKVLDLNRRLATPVK